MGILSFRDVSFRYQDNARPILNHVSVEFQEGAVTAIMGQSGSGKTTVLRLAAGMMEPESGEILFRGRNLKELDILKYRREDISVIFQSYELFPYLTAQENVSYSLELLGMDHVQAGRKAQEILEEMGLSGKQQKRLPGKLSGGEQQRVCIARAIALGSKVILADEPTGSLDDENRDHVYSLLSELAYKRNCCVILSTHDQELAWKADRVLRFREDGGLITDISR